MPYYTPTRDRISGRVTSRGLFGFSPAEINEARKNLSGATARTIGRYLAESVHIDIAAQVRQAAEDLRRAIERSDANVTGSMRRSVSARGTGTPLNPNAQPTRRTIDVEYAPYLTFVSDGTGPARQSHPGHLPIPARKRGGHWAFSRADADMMGSANQAMFAGSTNAQYGLLDWIEMKGITSEKYPDSYDLYRAIGMSITKGGIRPQHLFESAWGSRNWWEQQDTLFDTGYNISLNFGQAGQKVLANQWFDILLTFYRGGNLPIGLIEKGPSSATMQEIATHAQGTVYQTTNLAGR